MRRFFAIVAVCFASSAASAQVRPPYLGVVSADNVSLRAGPGEAMEETGVIPRGERLTVVQEVGEKWLAVMPPQGQISWIKFRCIEEIGDAATAMTPRNVRVLCDSEIDVAAGRPGDPKPLNVRPTKVPDGTLVVLIGPKVLIGQETWVPITPPAGDVRFIPKAAVDFARGVSTQNFKVSTPGKPVVPEIAAMPPASGAAVPVGGTGFPMTDNVAPGRQVPGTTVGRARPTNWPNDPLWIEAETAEQARDYPRAERLYLQLAANNNRPGGDQELVNLCFTRVHEVRKKQSVRPGTGTEPRGDESRPSAPRADDAAGPAWYGPGELRRAGFRVEGRSTFALVDRAGKVRCYIVAASNVDVENQLGREVEVFGSVAYPNDLRGVGLLTASRIQTAGRRRE